MANDTVDLWALDEVHFQQQGSRCRMWVPPETKGTHCVSSSDAQERRLFCRRASADGQFLFRREAGRFNGETFWEFLKAIPGGQRREWPSCGGH